MKVLIIGSGGREHALAWKAAQSPRVTQVFVAPGNAGTACEPGMRNVDVAADNIPGLLRFALAEKIDLTVVGPEGALVLGVTDEFSRAAGSTLVHTSWPLAPSTARSTPGTGSFTCSSEPEMPPEVR